MPHLHSFFLRQAPERLLFLRSSVGRHSTRTYAALQPSSVVILGVRFVRRPAENIDDAAHPHFAEPCGPDDTHVLLDEESSRNSTCPKVDVVYSFVRQRLLNYYVGDL